MLFLSELIDVAATEVLFLADYGHSQRKLAGLYNDSCYDIKDNFDICTYLFSSTVTWLFAPVPSNNPPESAGVWTEWRHRLWRMRQEATGRC